MSFKGLRVFPRPEFADWNLLANFGGGIDVANTVYLHPVWIPMALPLLGFSYQSEGAAGNQDFGLYTLGFRRILSTGTFAKGPNGVALRKLLPAPITIGAGFVLVAKVATVNNSFSRGVGTGFPMYAQAGVGVPLPAQLAPVAWEDGNFPRLVDLIF